MKKKGLLTAGIIAAFGLAIMTSSTVFASDSSNSNGMTTIVQKIAQKFNLNEADVKAVFDEERASRMAEMKTKFEGRLTTLVSEGKITEAQKALILAKHKDMVANRESDMTSMKDLSGDERKAAMDKKKAELEAWAKENGIDIQYLMPFGGKGHGFGPHMEPK